MRASKRGWFCFGVWRGLTGGGRAAIAVGHSILTIIYHLITRGTTYQELGADYLERRNSTARIRYLTRELEKLNLKVTVEPADQAA